MSDERFQLQSMLQRELEEGEPPDRIVAKHGLRDANILYEIVYGQDDWVEPGFSKEQIREKWAIEAEGRKERLAEAVSQIAAKVTGEGTRMTILEQGSGKGDTAFHLWQTLDSRVDRIDALELSVAGTEAAKSKYGGIEALRFMCGDAFEVPMSRDYDIVFHINVLEHVPEPLRFLRIGLDALKEDGYLLVMCPTLRYWVFWGWFKYLVCRFQRRRFESHSVSEWQIERFFKGQPCQIVHKEFFKVMMPSRVFKYFPPEAIRLIGIISTFTENYFPWKMACLQQFWIVRKCGAKSGGEPVKLELVPDKGSLLLRILLLPVACVAVICLWLISSVILSSEVLLGRKSFFEQC